MVKVIIISRIIINYCQDFSSVLSSCRHHCRLWKRSSCDSDGTCLLLYIRTPRNSSVSCRPCQHRREAELIDSTAGPPSEGTPQASTVRPLRAVLIVAIGTVVFMVVPSFVFCYLQEWKFGTALYFSFITLSTIGFGDYVAGSINYSLTYTYMAYSTGLLL